MTALPFVCLLFLLTVAGGCQDRSPLTIGFIGNLTGRHSDLGVSGRNGVLLAVEEINRSGGIGGRSVELLVRDDGEDPDVARSAVADLIDHKVAAIIGHMTSAMSRATVDLINEKKVLMISPTTATSELTGRDDYFVRVIAESRSAVEYLAQYMIRHKGLRRIAVVYDVSNKAFSEEWYTVLEAAAGGEARVEPFPTEFGSTATISGNVARVLESRPEGIVVVAAALDAALFCQQLRKEGSPVPVFSPMWAMTDDFLRHGGRAVEGMTFVHWYHKDYVSPESEGFRRAFRDRFHVQPDFAAQFAYEAARVLFLALAEDDDPAQLKGTIVSRGTFPGLQGDIVIDRYGDADRRVFLLSVSDGRFLPID